MTTIDPAAVVHRGDALSILPTLNDDSVDAVITDPPYNSGGRTPTERRGNSARGKYVTGDAKHDLADFTGDNRDQRGFVAWLGLVLADCLRLTRDGGSLLVFSDWQQLPATSDAVQVAGWTWRGIIPWHKPISRPQRNGFKRECEYVLWASNGPLTRHEPPIYLPGLYSMSAPTGRKRKHITQKPLALIRQLVRICPPGGTVLDPFAGSGTTGAAALTKGRKFVGVELSTHYHQVAVDRLAAA